MRARITILVDTRSRETRRTTTAKGSSLPTRLASGSRATANTYCSITGQGRSLQINAPALGIDLARTDALVLSHGPLRPLGWPGLGSGSSPARRSLLSPLCFRTAIPSATAKQSPSECRRES